MRKHNNWSSNLNSVKNKFFDFKELVRNEIDILLVIDEEIRNEILHLSFKKSTI